MKKYLLFATAVCAALAACTKNEVKPVEMDQEITYQTINTKATSAFNTDHKFYSWAYLLASGQNWADKYATSSPYITNSLIEYVPSSKAWKNSTTSYYWPKKSGLTFFAWSDATNNPSVGSATVNCSATDGITFTSYNTNTASTKNKDLLVAKIATGQNSNTTTYDNGWAAGVPTVFSHVLSALVVKAKTDVTYSDITFKVKSIDFTNVYSTGDYTQGHDASAKPTASSWSNLSSATSFDVYSPASESNPVTYEGIELAPVGEDVRIFMPQTFSDTTPKATPKASITYTVEYGTSGVIDEVTVEKDLKSIFTSNWRPGYKYTLTITLGLNQILWAPDVEPWSTGEGNFTI